MQPTPFQRLFTDDRPLCFLMGVGAIAMPVWTGSILLPTLSVSAWSIGEFALLMALAACLGATLGFFPCGMLLRPLLEWIERRNGAPFHVGDEVVILAKRFPGRVTRIDEVWAERHQVRVALGETERKKFTDVFSYTDVCRRPVGE